MTPAGERPLMTSSEVAQMLGVSRSTVLRWRFEGEGPKARHLTERTVRYVRSEVEAFVDGA